MDEYVLSDQVRRGASVVAGSDADPGVVVGGLRIATETGAVAKEVASPALVDGAKLPDWLGGGYLYWSPTVVYHSASLLGGLQPVLGGDDVLASLSFGPDFVLLRFRSGRRLALAARTLAPMSLPQPGLVDVAALADGRAALLLEPARVLVRAAGGKPWQEVSGRVRAPGAFYATADELWIGSGAQGGFRLERDGALTEFAVVPPSVRAPKRPLPDEARWPYAESPGAPLDRAVRLGVPLDARSALVEVAGAVARVELPTGRLQSITPRSLPPRARCELVPVAGDIVAACKTDQSAFVTRGLRTAKEPVIDITFASPASVFFSAGDGTLAFEGACGAARDATPTLCVRAAEGRWREVVLPVPDDAPDAGPARPDVVVRWIPRADGSAVAVLGGARPGLYDSAARAFSPFERDPSSASLDSLLRRRTDSRQIVDDGFTLTPTGGLRGYAGQEAITVERSGRLVRSPWVMLSLEHAGALAMARSNDGRLWQSTDWGAHWAEIAGPPADPALMPSSIATCSRVGCEIGPWLRLGYAVRSPVAAPHPPAPPAPVVPTGEPPRLECQPLAAARPRFAVRREDPNGTVLDEVDLGARTVPMRPGAELRPVSATLGPVSSQAVRALYHAELAAQDFSAPEAQPALRRAHALRYYDLLTPRAELRSARFTWGEVAEAAVRNGVAPDAFVDTDSPSLVPVLSATTMATDGVALLDSETTLTFWARPGDASLRMSSRSPESEGRDVAAAVAQGKDELTLLYGADDCGALVERVTPAGAAVVAELPGRSGHGSCALAPDALAIAPDGSLVVVRFPSGPLPPSADDPALVLRPGQPPIPLAPWSTLRSAATPVCTAATPGHRMLVVAPGKWLELRAPGFTDSSGNDPYALMLVRWSTESICLEAAEVPAVGVAMPDGNELATAVVVRFGDKVTATRLGYAGGAELSQPFECSFVPAP